MFSLSERKQERLYKQVMENEIVSPQMYNLYLGGVVVYGLLVNIILCSTCTEFVLRTNPLLFYIGYFVSVFAGTMISSKSNSPLISFLGYNLVVIPVGLVVTSAVYWYGGLSSYVVLQAIVYTAGIIIVEVVFLILGVSQSLTALAGAVLFSLYIGYDYYKAQQYPKTVDNAVDSALDIYLDIINLFLRILRILGSRSSSSSSKKNHF